MTILFWTFIVRLSAFLALRLVSVPFQPGPAGKDHLSEKEQVLVQNYRASFAALNKMLEERYQQLIAKLKKGLAKYTSMLELAFDRDVNIAFDGSIALADYVGVSRDRVLRDKSNIDNYFLN